jgi:hypothetical protein
MFLTPAQRYRGYLADSMPPKEIRRVRLRNLEPVPTSLPLPPTPKSNYPHVTFSAYSKMPISVSRHNVFLGTSLQISAEQNIREDRCLALIDEFD